jgi:hypothetical protein
VQGNNIKLVGASETCGMSPGNDTIVVYNYKSTSPAKATVTTGPCLTITISELLHSRKQAG